MTFWKFSFSSSFGEQFSQTFGWEGSEHYERMHISKTPCFIKRKQKQMKNRWNILQSKTKKVKHKFFVSNQILYFFLRVFINNASFSSILKKLDFKLCRFLSAGPDIFHLSLWPWLLYFRIIFLVETNEQKLRTNCTKSLVCSVSKVRKLC